MIIFDILNNEMDDYLIYKFYSDDAFVSSKDSDFKSFMNGINWPKDMNYRVDEDDNIFLDIPDERLEIFIFFKDTHKDDKDRYLTTNPLQIVFDRIEIKNNEDGSIYMNAVRSKKTPYVNKFKRIISQEDRSPAHVYLYF